MPNMESLEATKRVTWQEAGGYHQRVEQQMAMEEMLK
jgi:hypothetical protein